MPGVAKVPEAALRELAVRAAGTRRPRLFVLSAPSGTGKDTAIEALRRRSLGVTVVATYTTRPQRADETDGVDYNFVGRATFDAMRDRGALLEDAEYAGHDYGVPKEPIQEALARGEDVLIKPDVQGAAIIKLKVPSAVLIFMAPPDLQVLEPRIRARPGATEADVQRRLAAAARELACIPGFDYLVINHPGRLGEAVDTIETIIRAERARANVPPVVL